MSNWKRFNGIFEGHDYFLIRKIGIDANRTGKQYTPVIAQLIDGDLYTLDNELEALSWANYDVDGFVYEERNPFKAELEWSPIPE